VAHDASSKQKSETKDLTKAPDPTCQSLPPGQSMVTESEYQHNVDQNSDELILSPPGNLSFLELCQFLFHFKKKTPQDC